MLSIETLSHRSNSGANRILTRGKCRWTDSGNALAVGSPIMGAPSTSAATTASVTRIGNSGTRRGMGGRWSGDGAGCRVAARLELRADS